ncbi:MAG: response regulator [Pseudorhodoplanes sp.]|nr:response regulator [Pseudorhodoplanes sp.]
MYSAMQRTREELVTSARVLVIDDDYYMRKVIRSLLLAIGIKTFHEAANGTDGLEAICSWHPDIVLLDWEMPDMTGADFMRSVRSPGTFPLPDVSVIMITGHVERDRVVQAIRLGVNEFLGKPVSARALHDRILSIRARPRVMVQIGDYYGPEPRKITANSRNLTNPLEPIWVV